MLCIAEDVSCPYGLIFGGTDINEWSNEPRYKDIMLQAVGNARFVMSRWLRVISAFVVKCQMSIYIAHHRENL